MWVTLLVMAVAVSLEPFRIGMTLLMLNRPRPALQLLAFLCGGFTMGMMVGLVVLFVLRPSVIGSAHFTLPKVQIVIGALALVAAALVAVRVLNAPAREPGQGRFATWGRQLVNGPSLWVAGVSGLGIALPSVDYLAAMAVILASGAAVATQTGALVMFNVVAFALVEISLVAYLLAPDRTRASMGAFNGWVRSRRRPEVAGLLAVVGSVLMALGAAGL